MTTTNHPLPAPHLDPRAGPRPEDLTRLAELLRAYTPYDGTFDLRLPGVHATRASRLNVDLYHAFYHPSLCIVAQGAKSMLLGADVYEYDPSRMLVVSVDLPVASRVTRASAAEPFLALRLDLNPQRIAELALKVFPHGVPRVKETRGAYVEETDGRLVNAAVRLVDLMADERDAELLAPLVTDEILIRLLRGPVGSRVAQMGEAESGVQRVARAVEWVRVHFDEPMDVEGLAELVHMSPSSFHEHFKAVTRLSPLQYQKVLRLREARRLMLTSAADAATAGRQVGYASASQFSREYARLFGRAPTRDVAHLRAQAAAHP